MKEEKDTVNKMNVLVCTPGRLLQHMDETPMFDCVTLRRVLEDFLSRRNHLSAQGPSLVSIPTRLDAFQTHLTPFNSTPTFARVCRRP